MRHIVTFLMATAAASNLFTAGIMLARSNAGWMWVHLGLGSLFLGLLLLRKDDE